MRGEFVEMIQGLCCESRQSIRSAWSHRKRIFGMGVILLGITTGMKEHFGEGEEASTTDTFVAERGRLVVVF
jgi:hypothetical protein